MKKRTVYFVAIPLLALALVFGGGWWANQAGLLGQWLALSADPLENSLASLHLSEVTPAEALADDKDFPARLGQWLAAGSIGHLYLQSAAGQRLAVEFARI